MKTSIKNIINFRGLPVEVILPKYSAFVMTVFENGVRLTYGSDEVIAQQHIHPNGEGEETARNEAMDSAYRKAALYLAFNNPFALSALYRHIVRHYTEGKAEPLVWPNDKDYIKGIINMTTRAHDINLPMVSETELDDATLSTFDLTLRHDGKLFTANGNDYHLEMAQILSGLPVVAAEVN